MNEELSEVTTETTPEDANHNASYKDVDDYNADDVDHLKDAAHIRQNPTMYIGELGNKKGIHHLVGELLANSVDEALAGFCKNITVRIKVDGSLSIVDDGRGIPVEEHPKEKISTLEMVMTKAGAGGKFRKGSYKVSAGLHGMGAKAVTALSEWTEAQVQRGGRTYRQEYERGFATGPVIDVGPADHTGTRIKFKPDPEMFGQETFDYETIEERMRDLAYLNPGLTLALHDEREGKEVTFHFDNGLVDFVLHTNRKNEAFHEPIFFEKTVDEIHVQVALQYTTGELEQVRCFTNNVYNMNGGTHLSGFRNGLTRALNAYGTKQDLFKKVSPIGDDFRKGLTAILSVYVPEPQFDSQEKRKLVSPEPERPVASVVYEFLSQYVEEHPKEAQRILKKVAVEAEAREAASKARKALKDRKSILSGGGLPGKLFDCTSRDSDESELFIVEGDSAGGSAESGRERHYQAVLPLRGKPLNVEKARLENMLKNDEINSLISAIGIDIIGDHRLQAEEEEENGNGESDLKKLRYNKIVILTDADVDGQHIRTLLLTFFYRQMPLLVETGHIYVARPPLYKVTQKSRSKPSVRFIQSEDDMQEELIERGKEGTKLRVFPREGESAEERTLEGDELTALVKLILGSKETPLGLEDSLVKLERMGINLPTFFAQATDQGLPNFRVILAGHEHWFFTMEDVAAFQQSEQERLGRTIVIDDESSLVPDADGQVPEEEQEKMYIYEVHEVRKINLALEQLRQWSLSVPDLMPAVRVAGREPAPRLVLQHQDSANNLSNLRELGAEIRKLGERGMSVTRFKGLGEMDPEELWETTLDPDKRTLLQIRLEDAIKAEEMFRTLMGGDVEPRRDFIFKHRIRAKDIDYHGA